MKGHYQAYWILDISFIKSFDENEIGIENHALVL